MTNADRLNSQLGKIERELSELKKTLWRVQNPAPYLVNSKRMDNIVEILENSQSGDFIWFTSGAFDLPRSNKNKNKYLKARLKAKGKIR